MNIASSGLLWICLIISITILLSLITHFVFGLPMIIKSIIVRSSEEMEMVKNNKVFKVKVTCF